MRQRFAVLDVRDEDEFVEGHVPGARNIPLGQLRERMGELVREEPVFIYCQMGQRAYCATRAPRLNGYDAYNLSGGFNTYQRMVK
jgi:rhodanese-related sulfurtransferase